MSRYILFYKSGIPTKSDVELILSQPKLELIDSTSPRAMLVEADDEQIEFLKSKLENWVVSAEQEYPLPKKPGFSVKNDSQN